MSAYERRILGLLFACFSVAVVVGFIERWLEIQRMTREMERDFIARADEISERMQRAHAEEWRQ